MPYLNRCSFIGNLTRDPELRFQPTGEKQALCLLNVALNRDCRDETGEKSTQTTFINDIEVWGPAGEACAHFLTLGSLVFVEGRMEVDRWQEKDGGAKRTRTKIVADSVQFLKTRRAVDAPANAPAEASVASRTESRPRRQPRADRVET
jgi:single-strand DNA-binding protein